MKILQKNHLRGQIWYRTLDRRHFRFQSSVQHKNNDFFILKFKIQNSIYVNEEFKILVLTSGNVNFIPPEKKVKTKKRKIKKKLYKYHFDKIPSVPGYLSVRPEKKIVKTFR